MSIKPQYNTEAYFKREQTVSSQSIVECRFARSDDLADVVAVSVQVTPSDCSASSGRINYGGRLVCTVVYVDDGGKLCRVQKGAEFAHFVDGDNFTAAQSCLCRLSCPKNVVKRDGTSLVVSAVVNADITVFVKAERSYLIGCEGAECRAERVTLPDYILFSGSGEVEDEFEAEGVADVLAPVATPLVYSCECRSNVIVISGEVSLSLLAVRGDSPVSLERVVPFKAEVSCDEAISGSVESCRAAVEELSVTARVDEERGKCGIACAITLSFEGCFCDERGENAVVDLFCKDRELEITAADGSFSRCTGIESLSRRISAAVTTKAKLDFACAFKAVALPSCEYAYNAAEGTLEGAVYAVLIYEQSGEVLSTGVTMPFSVKAEGAEDCDIAVCGISVRQRAEGECEGEAVLKIACRRREKAESTLITSVAEGGEAEVNDSAVTVYIAEAGDDMWSLCKKLRQSQAELAACNPDLKFPLTGAERITLYRRKQE